MRHFISLFLLITPLSNIIAQKENTIEYCNTLIEKGVNALYKKDHTLSMEIFEEVKSISEQNKWYNQQYIAINCIGLNYYQMTDYSQALDYYLIAYSIALKHLGKDKEKTILNNIALVYYEQGKYNESEKHQKRAYDLAIASKDTLGIAIYANNLANLYNKTNRLNQALEYVAISKTMAIVKNDKRTLMEVSISEAQNYLQRKDYNKALFIVSPLIDKLTVPENNDNKIAALLVLSKVYQALQQKDHSLLYVKQAQKENLNYNNLKDIYNQYSSFYFTTKNYDKAMKYKDSVIIVKDSLNAIRNQAMYQNSEIKLKFQDTQKELKSEKKLKFYIIGFCVLILGLLSCLFRILYLKNKQKRIIAERNEQIISLELKNRENDNLLLEKQIKEKETETLLEKEKLKNELENKNRKLAANAIHVAQRNDKIEEYILKLKGNLEILRNDLLSSQLDQLKSILIKEDIHDNFLIHFEKTNSKFVTGLKEKHPDLSLNDIRFICYLYMNLSTKEIASIFNITIEACRKRKERISKKMNLSNSNELYNYISVI